MRFLFGFALLLPMVVYAEDPPLPEALLNAKTAFVLKLGATDNDFEKFYKALKKWGRFKLVQEIGNADIFIELSAGAGKRRSNERSEQKVEWETINMSIFSAWGNTLLWKDETTENSKDPGILVSNLKQKMKGK
jgi:hypothetical protein